MKSKSLISYKKEYSIDYLNIPELSDEFSLVKIISTPFSFRDKLFLENNVLDYPFIPGSEAVGLVEKINKKSRSLSYDMKGLKRGDLIYIEPSIICGNVNCETCLKGAYSVCPNGRRYGINDTGKYPYLLGTFSEYMVILPGSKVHKISSRVPIYHLNLIGLISKAIRCISKKGNAMIGNNLIILGFNLFSICCAIIANYIGMDQVNILNDHFNCLDRKILRELGVNFSEKLPEEKFDLIIDNKGDRELLELVINLAKPEAKILIPFDSPIDNNINFSRNVLIGKELSFIGVSNPSWDTEQAIKFIYNNNELLETIPQEEFNLDEFSMMMNKKIQEVKLLNILIQPNLG